MRIPRQVDGARTTPQGVDGLRASRQQLIGQLRAVAYWQRLVQARTDLVVAGLLYSAPVPVPGPPVALAEHWARTGPAAEDPTRAAELRWLAEPPEDLEVGLLVGGLDRGLGDGAGEHLDRLRRVASGLAAHRRGLDDELDAVTLALHDRLALDGAEEVGDPPTSPHLGGRSADRGAPLPG
jgi:hypothetical protein